MADFANCTVRDYLFSVVSESLFCELADENAYWEKANEFVYQVIDTPIGDLTPRQRHWLQRIKLDLME